MNPTIERACVEFPIAAAFIRGLASFKPGDTAAVWSEYYSTGRFAHAHKPTYFFARKQLTKRPQAGA